MEIFKYIEEINHQLDGITQYLQRMVSQKDILVHTMHRINESASDISQISAEVEQFTQKQYNSVDQVYNNSNLFNQLSNKLRFPRGKIQILIKYRGMEPSIFFNIFH